MDITKKTIDELKILAFDLMFQKKKAKHNLEIVLTEMQKRPPAPEIESPGAEE